MSVKAVLLAAGNYLFCCRCVHYGMGISFQRLARQRNIKRKQFSEPLRLFIKFEVLSKNLGKNVVMLDGGGNSLIIQVL